MKRLAAMTGVLTGMLIGLPLLGVMCAGADIRRYLEFPPVTRYVSHAPFSWPVFAGGTALVLAALVPFVSRVLGVHGHLRRRPAVRAFPWWGWAGIFSGLAAWVLAWSRFPWFRPLQPHTFTPLWLSLIVVVNALAYRGKGRCLMCDRTRFFMALFPASAAFWWFFEYLNRFVQNWYYTGVDFGPAEYFWYATLSFSTVLPAVLSVREWLRELPAIQKAFYGLRPIRVHRPRLAAGAVLILSAAGLMGIGVWPDYLFPLLWVSPLLIVVSLQALTGHPHILRDLARGDGRLLAASALAALICGGFWEMWNYHSMAKWEYAVPFVNRYRLFEMPALGYAGYLPFGLEVSVIGGLLESVTAATSPPARRGHRISAAGPRSIISMMRRPFSSASSR